MQPNRVLETLSEIIICLTFILLQFVDGGVGEVVVCSWSLIRDPMELYWSLKLEGIHLCILPIGLDVPYQAPTTEMIGNLLAIRYHPSFLVGYDFWIKRLFDIVVASLILLIGSPIYLLLAIAIQLDGGRPIFVKETRVGLKGKPIQIWKFRTQAANASQNVPHLTQTGRFLQHYSLDRLPQVLNVLRGELSWVGPRPLLLSDVERLSPHHHLRHNVMPGITGLCQVSGVSNPHDFEDAFRLDMSYIENWSLGLDLQILLKTFGLSGAKVFVDR